MPKNISKIYRLAVFMVLIVAVSSLLNIFLLVLHAEATQPIQSVRCHFANNGGEPCAGEYQPESNHSINYPEASIPECCLIQSRYYDAIINTDNDRPAANYTVFSAAQSEKTNPENNSSYDTSRLTYPPPAALALASTVIRE